MKVILLKEVKGLGKAGDLVNSKPGYFHNFLEKNGAAVLATPAVVKKWKADQEKKKAQEEERRQEAMALKDQLEGLQVTVQAKGGGAGRLFGSVTAQDIADALQKEHGLLIDKKKVELKESIRETGDFTVSIRVYPEVLASVKVQVVEA